MMGRACRTKWGEEKHIYVIGGKVKREETSKKNST
jgi:hypothetical protein